jgi:GxxExxY protein
MVRSLDFKHADVTDRIIGVFYDVYNELGHGFLESVYHKSFAIALGLNGLRALPKIEIPVWFRGHQVGDFEADLMVNDCVLVEIESVSNP